MIALLKLGRALLGPQKPHSGIAYLNLLLAPLSVALGLCAATLASPPVLVTADRLELDARLAFRLDLGPSYLVASCRTKPCKAEVPKDVHTSYRAVFAIAVVPASCLVAKFTNSMLTTGELANH
jgi:hypothetical protein